MARLRKALVGSAAAAALLAGGVALAATGGTPTVRAVDTTRLPLVRLVVNAPGASAQAPPSFEVRERGEPVTDLQVEAPDASAAIAVAIDTSQSMQGDPLTAALDAAATFVGGARERDRIAVVGFDQRARVERGLTAETQRAIEAVRGLELGTQKGTALYDGLMEAIDATDDGSDTTRRNVVVLTDGSDTTSTSTAGEVVAHARESGVVIHAIALAGKGFDPAEIETIARDTGGTFREAGVGELDALYAEISDEIAATYVLSYRTTATGQTSAEVEIDGTSVPVTFTAGAAPLARGPEAGTVPKSVTESRWAVPLLALLTALCVLVAVLRIFPRRPPVSLEARLRPYDSTPRAAAAATVSTADRARAGTRTLTLATERVLGRLSFWKSLGATLERADVPLRPAELFYIMVGSALGLAIPLTLAGMVAPVRLAGLVLGFLAPLMFVRMKASKREKAFDDQLPDVLVAMAASLKAGHSFNQAMDAIIKDGAEPASKEFGRAANQVRLGRSADEALEDMARRLHSKNFEFVVLCVNIQKQVGGSLAELLDSVGETVRQRQQFARKVKALVAMGKMSAYSLIALPFLMALVISVINPDYMKPLFESPAGNVMLGLAAGGMVLGTLVLRKIINFKVD